MAHKKTRFGYYNDANLILETINYLQRNLYHICTYFGALFIAIGGDFAYSNTETTELFKKGEYLIPIIWNNYFLLVLGILLGLYGLRGITDDLKALKEENIKLKQLKPELEKLKNKLDITIEDNDKLNSKIKEKHEDLVKSWLKMISLNLELSVDERLTIYFEQQESFTLLARYSQNKNYDKIHNQKFPLNKGVISKAWERNEWIENAAPRYEENNEDYINYMVKEYSYTKKKLNSITMKTDKFFGIAIQEADENIGVLLYEKISGSEKKEITDFNTKCEIIRNKHTSNTNYLIKYVKEAIKLEYLHTINTSEPEDDLFKMMGE